jgi:putative NADPH-quinone reductase
MTRTLVLLFHPDMSRSRANRALANAAASLPGTEIRDMHAIFPDGRITMMGDAEGEARHLLAADRIVLQFPIQWYSTPALLKAWQDAVLTRMYYVHAASEGDKLIGTPLMIAATAGNTPTAYSAVGMNGFTMIDILTPLKATAHRCGLPLADPFILYEADKLDEYALAHASASYQQTLKGWIEQTTPANA